MPDIASSDVSYSLVDREVSTGRGDREFVADATFGNGVLTYPAAGVPLDKAQLGCPNTLRELHIIEPDADNGFVYKYDASAESLRIYQEAGAAGELAELTGGVSTPASATLRLKAKGF